MSRIVDSLTLYCTNKREYIKEPVSPILLDIKDTSYSNYPSYSSEYYLNTVFGYKFWLNEDSKDLLPKLKLKMLTAFAHEFFGEFKPTIKKLYERAYKNGDRESIALLESLEKQMFNINFKG